jgi:hypothetical protein
MCDLWCEKVKVVEIIETDSEISLLTIKSPFGRVSKRAFERVLRTYLLKARDMEKKG